MSGKELEKVLDFSRIENPTPVAQQHGGSRAVVKRGWVDLVNIGESYVVSYLISNVDDSQEGESAADQNIPYKLKLKIFPPYNLENPDVV